MHKVGVALRIGRRQPHVFIQVKRNHVFETHTLPVVIYEFLIDTDRGGTGRQPQHGRFVFLGLNLNIVDDFLGIALAAL